MASRGLLTCIFVYFVIEAKYVFVSGQFTLETSSSVAVVGTDFTLTCTLSQNTSVPTFISWTKGAVSNFINPSPCTVAGTNKWPSYAYTCNNKVFTLTIPGDDIDPENDNNVQWTCGNGGGTNSNPLTMTVLTLSDLKMRGLDEDKELRHESDVVTITIKTGCVYPAAFIKIIFVDKDDTSKEYYEITQNATENAVATASANCSNPAKVYEVELRITRELVETDRPVKVKAALTFASVSQTFSSKTSNFTITVYNDTNEYISTTMPSTHIITTTPGSNSGWKEQHTYVIGCSVGLILIIVVVIIVCCWRKKKKNDSKKSLEVDMSGSSSGGSHIAKGV